MIATLEMAGDRASWSPSNETTAAGIVPRPAATKTVVRMEILILTPSANSRYCSAACTDHRSSQNSEVRMTNQRGA